MLTLYKPSYEGGKEMLLVEDVDDKEFLCDLLKAMHKDLPDARHVASRSSGNT